MGGQGARRETEPLWGACVCTRVHTVHIHGNLTCNCGGWESSLCHTAVIALTLELEVCRAGRSQGDGNKVEGSNEQRTEVTGVDSTRSAGVASGPGSVGVLQ